MSRSAPVGGAAGVRRAGRIRERSGPGRCGLVLALVLAALPAWPQEAAEPSESVDVDPELEPDVFFMPGQAADGSLDLEAVLARHQAARGGSAGDVQTVQGAGTVVMLGFEVPMKLAFARPAAFRIDIDLQGLPLVLASDGRAAWSVSPMQGIVDPAPLPEEMAGAVSILSDFLWGLLRDAEERGLEVTLAGIEQVERDETYRLEIAASDGIARTLDLGGEDFLERRVAFDGAFLGASGRLDVTLGSYMDVGGLKVPGTIRIAVEDQVMAELRIANAEANADVDPASFSMPAPAAAPETPEPAVQEL